MHLLPFEKGETPAKFLPLRWLGIVAWVAEIVVWDTEIVHANKQAYDVLENAVAQEKRHVMSTDRV